MKKYILLFLLIHNSLFSQVISGNVYDKTTEETLPGASVYVDGTTIGVTTNFNGYFELDVQKSQNASIIVSFIGYETQVFSLSEFTTSKNIFLIESTNQLNEVELGLDIWSREKKLRIFKSEFLGYAPDAKACKILNEKDIILIYNSALNTLTAYADNPIIIKNYYLGYEIRYNLVDFEIYFINTPSGFRMTDKVYYAGTSFFIELKKKTKTKIIKNRDKEYDGSLIHFMRSLSTQQLTENKFGIYFGSLPTNPYRYFKISKENNQTKVEMTTDKLSILYNMFDQSSILPFVEKTAIFYIDETGNHSPPNSLLFGGVLGQKRIINMLPLNYAPKTAE